MKPSGLGSELERVKAHNAALRVAARRDDLLQRHALEELAAALGEHIPLGSAAVVVPERDDQVLYEVSLPGAAEPIGSRSPLAAVAHRRTIREGLPRICRDTRRGDALDRAAARAGHRSYAALPIRDPLSGLPAPVLAQLVVSFAEVDQAGEVPLELLEEVAALFGSSLRRSRATARARRLGLLLETSGAAMPDWSRDGKISNANAAASHVVAVEQQSAEYRARLRLLEREQRSLLDNAPLVIFRLDPVSGELLHISRRAEQVLGLSQQLARERPDCLRAAHADAAAARSFDAAFRAAQRGIAHAPYEARLIQPNGTEVAARVQIYALAERERVTGVEGILSDISLEQAARSQLVQTNRLATLGQVAAGVAHEINNPAAFLMLGLEHLERSLEDLERADSLASAGERRQARELVRQMSESLQRIADIVRDLRHFSGPVRPRTGSEPPADVNRAVQSALRLTRSQLVERAQLILDLQRVPPARIEQGRLWQVLVNLPVNAAQAIPAKAGGEPRIMVATRSGAGGVEIEVTDTGVGIAPEVLARIWTPFFTTKQSGGTGLGLSISRDLVERAGGSIEVMSPVRRGPSAGSAGTRFTVRRLAAGSFAVSSRAAAHRLPSVFDTGVVPRRRRVLVVEDEVALAGALAQQLSDHHEVRVTNSAARALELLSRERFDVVLTDLRMPELSGEALYEQACASCPDYRGAFLFMTGVGFGGELARLQQAERLAVLEKPLSQERLLHAIAQVRSTSGGQGEGSEPLEPEHARSA